MDTLTFRNNGERHRYEAFDGNTLAGFVEYNQLTNATMLAHTEVLPAYEGKGVGSFLARESIGAVRAGGKRLIPACPFIASYLRKHRELLDLVDDDVQKAYKI